MANTLRNFLGLAAGVTLILTGSPAWATSPVILVHIESHAAIRSEALAQAKDYAADVYAAAGLSVVWEDGATIGTRPVALRLRSPCLRGLVRNASPRRSVPRPQRSASRLTDRAAPISSAGGSPLARDRPENQLGWCSGASSPTSLDICFCRGGPQRHRHHASATGSMAFRDSCLHRCAGDVHPHIARPLTFPL